jgi:hypothetical protein
MNPVLLPSNDAYVNVFPKLLAKKTQQPPSGRGKSILSGKVFESAEPMSNKNELFNTSGYFNTPHHGKSR